MQQMRTDTALLTKDEGGSPIRNPPTAAEDARLASLISLDNILKQVKVCYYLLMFICLAFYVLLRSMFTNSMFVHFLDSRK